MMLTDKQSALVKFVTESNTGHWSDLYKEFKKMESIRNNSDKLFLKFAMEMSNQENFNLQDFGKLLEGDI